MKISVRVPLIVSATAAIVCVIVVLAARGIALRHLPLDLQDPHQIGVAEEHLRYQLRALGILATFGAAAVGWIVGAWMMRPFEQLRAQLIAGTISQSDAAGRIPAWSADATLLRQAALRHESDLLYKARELAREAADLIRMVNTVSEGLVQLDLSSRVIQVNPAALDLLGLPRYVHGQPLVSLIRSVELRDVIARAVTGEVFSGVEVGFEDKRLLISASSIPGSATGVASTTVLAIADLTQLRRLEGVRRDFVANVSHELKTPLTSIQGYAETLRADDDLPLETRHQFLDVINRNAIRLQYIVDDLLDLSRIESGVWNPRIAEVDVVPLVLEAWESCQEPATTTRPSFVPPQGSALVFADAEALRHVFSNLFDNAIRYTPPSGTITVQIYAERDQTDDPRVTIEVSDTGSGIPRESLPRIFERFYRVDPARSRGAGGTGLGLAIVKHLMDSMNGTVSADSVPGMGTTITLRLPAV